MYKSVLELVNDKEQELQISVKFDNNVIELPLSTFNNLLTQVVTEFIMDTEKDKEDIIDIKKEMSNIQTLKSKFCILEDQIEMIHNIINRMERDLKVDKFAQPFRLMGDIKNTHTDSKLSIYNETWDIAPGYFEKKPVLFTISDSEEDEVICMTKFKPIEMKNKYIVDKKNDSQKLIVKYEPGLKLKANVSLPNVNGNDIVLPITTDTDKSLNSEKYGTRTLRKRKPGPKSKTVYVEDRAHSITENKETDTNKICLYHDEVITNKKSKSNLFDCSSVAKCKLAENPKPYFCFKFSSKNYPPPLPSIPPHNSQPLWKNVPPIPEMKINITGNIVTLTWDLNLSCKTAEIKMYELFVCQETDAHPDISMWKKKGNINPERLPMVWEIEIFELGYIYHFAMRAVDVHDRCAPFVVQNAKI